MAKQGVPPPNYTQIPNAILDLMHDMSECEFRVTIAIARKTFGWHKDRDKLSLSQLRKLTGLSKQGVIDGIEQGEKRGIVEREAIDETNPTKGFYYNLVVQSVDKEDELVNVVDNPSQRSRQVDMRELVNVVDTQKKGKQTKQKKEGVPPHPFVVAFKDVFHRSPNRLQIAMIQEIPPSEESLTLWTSIVTEWCVSGWSPTNIKGMIDKFNNTLNEPAPPPTLSDCTKALESINSVVKRDGLGNTIGQVAKHATALAQRGETHQSIRSAWLACKKAKSPVGAFMVWVRDGNLVVGVQGEEKIMYDDFGNKLVLVQGIGWQQVSA